MSKAQENKHDLDLKPVEDGTEWNAARAIREQVFVQEQSCPPEEEWDGHDADSRHLLAFVAGQPAATARWRAITLDGHPAAKLERFAVLAQHRGRGLGRHLVRYAMDDASEHGYTAMLLNAQAHLQAFYAEFGFEPRGEVFEEAGIPHIEMVRTSGESR